MPTIKNVEKKISKIEGFNVRFMSNGKDVRGDMDIPTQYQAQKMSKNSYSVGEFKQKLKRHFVNFDFEVLKKDGTKARGQTKLSTVRDTYLED